VPLSHRTSFNFILIVSEGFRLIYFPWAGWVAQMSEEITSETKQLLLASDRKFHGRNPNHLTVYSHAFTPTSSFLFLSSYIIYAV
jgi:hypothetical protein